MKPRFWFGRSRLIVAAALALIALVAPTGCSSGATNQPKRTVLSAAQQRHLTDFTDDIERTIIAAGYAPVWSEEQTNSSGASNWTLFYGLCANCGYREPTDSQPVVLRGLTGKPADDYRTVHYRDGDLRVRGHTYHCNANLTDSRLTATALRQLPVRLKGAKPGSPTIVVDGTRFICTVERS